MHIFHKWSKWSRPQDNYTGKRTQWRECLSCGFAQHRNLGYDEQTPISSVSEALESVNKIELTTDIQGD